jgi:hypothetical protein
MGRYKNYNLSAMKAPRYCLFYQCIIPNLCFFSRNMQKAIVFNVLNYPENLLKFSLKKGFFQKYSKKVAWMKIKTLF